jgi:hypothetical protein
MKCKSLSTVNPDGYRAGSELGEGLRDLAPEVVLLFASITYADQFSDVFDGLFDGLGARPIVFGGTSDGIYETSRVAPHGISALALNTGGAAQWTVALEYGVGVASRQAAQKCAQRIKEQLDGDPTFAFALADGVKADGSALVEGISAELDIPFIGALACDDRKFTKSLVLVDGDAHEDAVALLGARGNVPFVLSSASGWEPVGQSGRIEEAHGSVIERISGITPQEFLKQQLGKTPGETDLGMVPIAAYHPEAEGHFCLRTPSHFDPVTGAATMFGSVDPHASVRVCTATLEDVLRGVEEAMTAAQQSGFQPAGALVVSCAGRRWLLDERSPEEMERVFSSVGSRIPLIGLPSFGEMGPFRKSDGSYTPTFFHNVTFVICLFGDR